MNSTASIREAALTQERIDTHGHLYEPFPSLLEQAQEYGKRAHSGHLADARVAAEGCRVLYGIDPGVFLGPDAPEELFRQAADLRAKGFWPAIECALDKARIRRQFAFCGRTLESVPFRTANTPQRLSYLAYIDDTVNGDGGYPSPDFKGPFCYYERLCAQFGPLRSLEDYLAAVDKVVDAWPAWGVVGMKTAIAYTSGLAISNPSLQAARSAFQRKEKMWPEDVRTVRDCAFRRALDACLRNELPVVIHTGYLIWGHGDLTQANPMLLHNLLIDERYRDLTFVLLHGGFPYVGETSYLAGMFSNVIIDFTWFGWLAPNRFRAALTEWLELVPNDRFCWGSDSGGPETIAGIDQIMRRQIADVLEQAQLNRTIDESYALEFIENSYRRTAERVFGLGS